MRKTGAPVLVVLSGVFLAGCFGIKLHKSKGTTVPPGTRSFRHLGSVKIPGLEPGKASRLRPTTLSGRPGKVAFIAGKDAYVVDLETRRMAFVIRFDERISDLVSRKGDPWIYVLSRGRVAAYDPVRAKILWKTNMGLGNYVISTRRGNATIIHTVSGVSFHRIRGSNLLLVIGRKTSLFSKQNRVCWVDVRSGKVIRSKNYRHRMDLFPFREVFVDERARQLHILNLLTGRIERRIDFDPAKDLIASSKLTQASNYRRFHEFYWRNFITALGIGSSLHLFSWKYDNALLGRNSLEARLTVYDQKTGATLRREPAFPPSSPAYRLASFSDDGKRRRRVLLPYFAPRRDFWRFNLAGFLELDLAGQGKMKARALPPRPEFKEIRVSTRRIGYGYNDEVIFRDRKTSFWRVHLPTGKTRPVFDGQGRKLKTWRYFGRFLVLGYRNETVVIDLKKPVPLARQAGVLLTEAYPDRANNRLLLMSVDRSAEPYRAFIQAIDLLSGKKLWEYRPRGGILIRPTAFLRKQGSFYLVETHPGPERVLTRLDTATGRPDAMLPLIFYTRFGRSILQLTMASVNGRALLVTYPEDRVSVFSLDR